MIFDKQKDRAEKKLDVTHTSLLLAPISVLIRSFAIIILVKIHFSNQASLLSQTGSFWWHLKSMNCVTKRLCTPRTHSHDYGYWARACYEQGCEVFKKATQN